MTAKADVAVALTFDVDAMSGWITLGATSPSAISRGEFGAVAIWRVLELLERVGVPATCFVPGHTALALPAAVRAIAAGGHEIAHHGWVHENPARLSLARERQALRRGLDALERTCGRRPVGYRAPAWELGERTVELLLEHGFAYDSSMMGGDDAPYWCRIGDRFSTTDQYVFGEPVALVELPVSWHLDDAPQLEYILTETLVATAPRTPEELFASWLAEVDHLRAGGGLLTLTMHPEVIGRGRRIALLERFVREALARPEVRFTTCGDYARAWRAGRTPDLGAIARGRQESRDAE